MSVKAIAWAIDQRVGDVEAKMILIILANSTSAETNACECSLGMIAATAELSIKTVQRRLTVLGEKGLIAKTPRTRTDGGKSSNAYHLLMLPRRRKA